MRFLHRLLANLWYIFFKNWLRIALFFFYQKWEVANAHNVPKDRPVLFVPNHPNGFMDAIVIACSTCRKPHFLVRADVFATKLTALLLSSYRMMPIFRQRDGMGQLSQNESIFKRCFQLLKRKHAIIIFSEGTHDRKRQLRPIKKGVARIGIGAEAESDFRLNLSVIPVGINYSEFLHSGSSLLVNFGKPIALSQYKGMVEESSGKAMNVLREQIARELEELIVNIPDHYEWIEPARELWNQAHEAAGGSNSLLEALKRDRVLIEKMRNAAEKNPKDWNTFVDRLEMYLKARTKLGFKEKQMSWDKTSWTELIAVGLLLLVFLPLHLVGFVVYYVPYKIPDWIVHRFVSDDHFNSSIKLVVGAFLFPIYYLIQIPLVFRWIDHYAFAWMVAILLPFTGLFAHFYWKYLVGFYQKLQFKRATGRGEETLRNAQRLRAALLDWMKRL